METAGVSVISLPLGLLLAGFGTVLHLIGKVSTERDKDGTMTIRRYIRRYPYKTLHSTIASVAVVVSLWTVGQLTAAGALTAGVAVDSILRRWMKETPKT